MIADVDVRDVLGAIRVPTLVAHVPGAREEAAYVAERIPGARRFEVPGPDGAIYLQAQTLLPELERFTASLGVEEKETVLATVLFTDIVGSTAKLAELGDARWRELVERHHAVIRQQLGRFRGTEVDTAGDGFFATFDGPIRAIKCATAITESLRKLGLEVRAGLHTGECEVIGDKITGIAVNIGARIAARAGPGEILVSSTVKDLVAGSGLGFADVGEHQLKGIPGAWRIYRVSADT
jgi:class 3 adenylate cyclase